MRNRQIKNLHQAEGVTYVNGLGFVEPDNKRSLLSEIRKYSAYSCLVIFVYLLCKDVFIIPATHLANILGFDVGINRYTGMIMTTPLSDVVIYFFINVGALSISVALAYVLCARHVTTGQYLCRPKKGETSAAIPIVISTGVVGVFLSEMVSGTTTLFGVILPNSTSVQVSVDMRLSVTLLVTTILVCILEEFLFRGVILFSLRIFGDGFAIIISSVLFSVFKQNALDIVCWFFISLALGYFTLRAGSTLTAVACRVALVSFNFITAALRIYVDSELALVITCILSLIALIWAASAYVLTLKQDKQSFTVKQSQNHISLVKRVGAFAGSPIFIILLAFTALKIIFSLQFIG